MVDSTKKPKETSYTYWVPKGHPGETKPDCAPKKVDLQQAEYITSLCRQSSQGSTWNSAGTWY